MREERESASAGSFSDSCFFCLIFEKKLLEFLYKFQPVLWYDNNNHKNVAFETEKSGQSTMMRRESHADKMGIEGGKRYEVMEEGVISYNERRSAGCDGGGDGDGGRGQGEDHRHYADGGFLD